MMTLTQERQRIRQLVRQDRRRRNQLGSFYTDAMSIISAHLNEFYLQYATDQGLTMAQTEQQVGQWDIDHFKSAIDQLLSGVNPDEMLSQRLQVAYAQSKMTRRDMLNAMIAAGMAVATYKAQEYGKKAIVDDYQEGYRRRTGQEPLKQGNPSSDSRITPTGYGFTVTWPSHACKRPSTRALDAV